MSTLPKPRARTSSLRGSSIKAIRLGSSPGPSGGGANDRRNSCANQAFDAGGAEPAPPAHRPHQIHSRPMRFDAEAADGCAQTARAGKILRHDGGPARNVFSHVPCQQSAIEVITATHAVADDQGNGLTLA